MKIWIVIGIMVLFLGGSAAVLLSTEQAPLPVAEPTPAPVVEAPAAEPEKKVMSTEEFRTLGAEAMGALPNVSAHRKGEDLPILIAADQFGRINEAAGEEVALQEEAFTLYRECANSGQYQDSVRALCYWNLKNLGKKLGKQLGRNAGPPHIRDLANQL